MTPFGKQQEILNFLPTTNPEALSGDRRALLIEDEKSALRLEFCDRAAGLGSQKAPGAWGVHRE